MPYPVSSDYQPVAAGDALRDLAEIADTIEGKSPMRTRHVLLDAASIARAGASDVLAIDRGAIGKTIALTAAEPHHLVGPGREPAEAADLAAIAASPDPHRQQGVVAVVAVRGPLAQRALFDFCGYVDGYDAVAARFEKALGDTSVDAVVIEIDSPGGDVAGLEQCVERMRTAAARSGKPVHAFINECACSAAYWIVAAVASEITIPPAGRAGSIGCIGGIVDQTEALKMQGLAVTLVRWPEGKAESHPAGPVQPLATERLTARVQAAGERFAAAMAKVRPGLTTAAIKDLNGDVLEGKDAVKAGLVDKVGDFEKALESAATAGRKWRRQAEKAMLDQKRFEELEAFEKTVLGTFGAKDQKSAIGAMTAAKEAAERVPEIDGKLAAAEENNAALQKQLNDEKASRLLAAAKDARKIVPANQAKAEAFYAKHGIDAFESYLDSLVAVAPAASTPAPAAAPAVPAVKPAAIETEAAPAANGNATPTEAQLPKWEDMSAKDKHDFLKTHGETKYRAVRADWERRGRPRGIGAL
ncbi:MAG: S49 family peptidase [Polyangiaceae bacterium]|nr:S49 family peptidase [Polyangiaceae bacterium]